MSPPRSPSPLSGDDAPSNLVRWVLLVEDNPDDVYLMRAGLHEWGDFTYRLVDAPTLGEALALLEERFFDVVLLDLSLPDSFGPDGASKIRARHPDLPIVVLSSLDDTQTGRLLVHEGAQEYLVKGELGPRALGRTVQQAIERYKLECELRVVRQAALAASAAKSVFLAAVSHDIRTPLGSIIGMAELLLCTPLVPEQADYARAIQRSGRALSSLLNNVLELSSIESDHFELRKAPFVLEDLVWETLELFAFGAHSKKIGLALEIDPTLPMQFEGDVTRIRQVLINLIGNAVKFTSQGAVLLRALPKPRDGDPDALCLEVVDSGRGIAKERTEAIFERFEQADSSVRAAHGGVGLGLAICREIVSHMGGEIGVRSRPGAGSTFWVRLPLRAVDAPSPGASSALADRRCIVAIADATERSAVTQILESAGARVSPCAQGSEAASLLASSRKGGPPISLVTDLRLAGGGLDLLREALTHDPGTRAVALLAVDHRPGDLEQCGHLGAIPLYKPVRPSLLVQALSGEAAKVAGPVPASATTLRGVRVLLVEDFPDNRTLLVAFLRGFGCEVEAVEDGDVALEILANEHFDLVLMDMDMPRLPGLEATARFRALEMREGRARTPVVALTAHAFEEQARLCLAAGCDAHVSKPIDRATLRRVVESHLGTGGDEGSSELADLVPGYLENRSRDVETLRRALLEGDYPTVQRLGHRMKGSGGGYGLPEITRTGSELEDAALHEDGEAVRAAIEALVTHIARVAPRFSRADSLTAAP